MVIIPEKVPTKIRSIPIPSAKEKRVKKPRKGFASFATYPSIIASAGVKHGDVTVPDNAPSEKVSSKEPLVSSILRERKNDGMYIS